jgi:two-component system, NarL family, invasion response regulator UvrY
MQKVLMVEDHSIVMKGFRLLFEKNFGSYELDMVSSIAEMMMALKKHSYQMAVVDMQLEDGLSLNIIPDVVQLYPQLAILMFTGYAEDVYAQRLYSLGVKGFLNKNAEESEIMYALQTVLAGKTYFSESYKNVMLNRSSQQPTNKNPFSQLSNREMETALLMLQGKRSSEICSELNIQPSTVTTYKIKIFTKLQITNVVDLERLATLYQVV